MAIIPPAIPTDPLGPPDTEISVKMFPVFSKVSRRFVEMKKENIHYKKHVDKSDQFSYLILDLGSSPESWELHIWY